MGELVLGAVIFGVGTLWGAILTMVGKKGNG